MATKSEQLLAEIKKLQAERVKAQKTVKTVESELEDYLDLQRDDPKTAGLSGDIAKVKTKLRIAKDEVDEIELEIQEVERQLRVADKSEIVVESTQREIKSLESIRDKLNKREKEIIAHANTLKGVKGKEGALRAAYKDLDKVRADRVSVADKIDALAARLKTVKA